MRLFLATTALALLTSTGALAFDDATASDMRADARPPMPMHERTGDHMPPREAWENMSQEQREQWKKEHPQAAKHHQEMMQKRHAMKEKWQDASPEERQQMKEQWKEKHPDKAERLEEKRTEWQHASPEERQEMKSQWKEKHPQAAERMQMKKERPTN